MWSPLVAKIRAGDPAGMEELYAIFRDRGFRFYLWKRLGLQDLDDHVHNALLELVKGIRRWPLKDPEALMGYAMTVVRREVAHQLERRTFDRATCAAGLEWALRTRDPHPDPEQIANQREQAEIVRRALGCLKARDREILIRVHLREQPAEHIQAAMHLTATQFQVIKSRAKLRFGEIGKRALKPSMDVSTDGSTSAFTRGTKP